IHKGALQVGGFVASSDTAADLMLDAIFRDEIVASINSITFFAFADAPGLGAALRRRGLSVDRYWYLGKNVTMVPLPPLPDARGAAEGRASRCRTALACVWRSRRGEALCSPWWVG